MNKPRRVLMLVENLPVPADPRVWHEALTLRDHHYQVSVICPKGASHHQEAYIRLENIDIYRYKLPNTQQRYFSYLIEYTIALFMTFYLSLKVLFQRGFDIIHACNPPDMFFIIGFFYRLCGKKYVFDHHDLVPELFQIIFHGKARALYKIMLLMEWCNHHTAHLVIFTNQSQQMITRRSGCPPQKSVIVRSAPRATLLKPVEPEVALKRGRRYLLAYVGVMGAQDGVEYTLYALDELVHKRGRQDIGLVLMGDGDHAPVLQKLVRTLQLDAYVHFTGWVAPDELSRYLSVADIGLSPDPQNGLNEYCTMIKTMDYMTMGKPVVAFDLIETRFTAQGAALYASANDVHLFADNIETLLNDAALRQSMGALGQARIKNELRWEHQEQLFLKAYETLFQKPVLAPRLLMNDPKAK